MFSGWGVAGVMYLHFLTNLFQNRPNGKRVVTSSNSYVIIKGNDRLCLR